MKTKKPAYVTPEIEIVEFETEDVIVTSCTGDTTPTDPTNGGNDF